MMSQTRRHIQLPLLGTILLSLFVAVYLAACRRFTKKSASSGKITKHTVKTPSEEVLKYWTADKMQHAKGVEMPRVDAPDQAKQHPHKSGPQ
jgi:hypothetical protein